VRNGIKRRWEREEEKENEEREKEGSKSDRKRGIRQRRQWERRNK
jgi:hypothetical protein